MSASLKLKGYRANLDSEGPENRRAFICKHLLWPLKKEQLKKIDVPQKNDPLPASYEK